MSFRFKTAIFSSLVFFYSCSFLYAVAVDDTEKKSSLVAQLSQSSPLKLYMGGTFFRGLLEISYQHMNPSKNEHHTNPLLEQLIEISKNGKPVLDLGCGNAGVALDIFSPLVEGQLTWSTRQRYLPGSIVPPEEKGMVIKSLTDWQEIFVPRYQELLKRIRENPPRYIGITASGIGSYVVEKHYSTFANEKVRILAGRYFHEILDEELVTEGEKFPLIIDNFGVLNYSEQFPIDFARALSLLELNGLLFIATNRDFCFVQEQDLGHSKDIPRAKTRMITYLQQVSGLEILNQRDDAAGEAHIIIKKNSDELILPCFIKRWDHRAPYFVREPQGEKRLALEKQFQELETNREVDEKRKIENEKLFTKLGDYPGLGDSRQDPFGTIWGDLVRDSMGGPWSMTLEEARDYCASLNIGAELPSMDDFHSMRSMTLFSMLPNSIEWLGQGFRRSRVFWTASEEDGKPLSYSLDYGLGVSECAEQRSVRCIIRAKNGQEGQL